MLCGFLCGGSDDALGAWLAQLLPSAGPTDADVLLARDALREYAEPIERSVLDPGLGLEISDLDDSAPLIERASAV